MPFPRRLLTEDEDVIVELRPHWAFLGWPLVAAVGAIAVAIAIAASFSLHPAVGVLLLVLVGGSALWLSARLIRWFATTLVVTNTRIVQRSGVLSRNGFELRLERVNQLSYHQSIVDRIFRTGELHVEMGGDTGVVLFDHVPRPAAVQAVITEQIDALHHRYGPAADSTWEVASSPGPMGETPPSGTPRVPHPPFEEGSVAGRLVELDELRRRGILTEAEFASKKAELLDRL